MTIYSLFRGHLTFKRVTNHHPKKVTKNCQEQIIRVWWFGKGHDLKLQSKIPFTDLPYASYPSTWLSGVHHEPLQSCQRRGVKMVSMKKFLHMWRADGGKDQQNGLAGIKSMFFFCWHGFLYGFCIGYTCLYISCPSLKLTSIQLPSISSSNKKKQ